MSSITSLISGGGGGGGETHIVTDPKKLLKTAVSRIFTQLNAGGITDSRDASFFVGSAAGTNMFATAQTSSSDTYVTLLNVSNADGGYLHWLLSTGINTANESSTVKITVDGGTPVELTYQPSTIQSSIGSNRMLLGGGLQTQNLSTSGVEYGMWNSTTSSIGDTNLKALEDTTNNVYVNSTFFAQGYIQTDLNLLRGMPYQRLYFSSSLLVEVKQSTYNTTSNNQYAGCMYSLI